jgi:hypothetical protein
MNGFKNIAISQIMKWINELGLGAGLGANDFF